MAVNMATKYHRLGRALRRIMSAENVQAASQEDFARKLSDGGYPIAQQLISDYVRTWSAEENGQIVERPRTYAPMEFIAAVIVVFHLNDEQINDLVASWLEILPEKKRIAVLALADALRRSEVPVEAWRDMLEFEQDRGRQETEEHIDGATTGGRTP